MQILSFNILYICVIAVAILKFFLFKSHVVADQY